MKNIFFAAGLLIAVAAQAQNDYAFRVLANKGPNQVKSGETWMPVKTGSQLMKDDELKLSENSSIGLVSKTGKPLELKEAKTYKVIELLAQIGNATSVLNKYTDFILSSNSDEARKNRLSATGAVHRGVEDIKVFLPQNQNAEIFGTKATFRWEATKSEAPFIVVLQDVYGSELLKIETNENSTTLDLSNPKLIKEPVILIEVVCKADTKNKSEQHLIKKLSSAKFEQTKKLFSEASADLNEETAFNNYLLAAFYEENKLLIDAITCYEQAIKMDQENPTYQDAYDEFLLRNKTEKGKITVHFYMERGLGLVSRPLLLCCYSMAYLSLPLCIKA
ncbi:MAG: hypothetical protein JST48_05280 [Bacteroidetes bacterium]|nr:hypothetical protein [Bacteroidota bacterium]